MKYKNNKIVYEVGDWVVGWHHKGENLYNDAWRIKSISGEYVCPENNPNWNTGRRSIRLATQEEIDAATREEKIMVGKYEVDFGNASGEQLALIKVGCVCIDKEKFLKIGKRAEWL